MGPGAGAWGYPTATQLSEGGLETWKHGSPVQSTFEYGMFAIWTANPALGQQSTFRVRIHRPWHGHNSPTDGLNGSYAKGGTQAGKAWQGARSGVPTEGPLAQKLQLLFRRTTQKGGAKPLAAALGTYFLY